MQEPANAAADWVGRPLDRVDGRLKVTGAAKYSSDFLPDNCLHAVAFVSDIAKGRVLDIDTSLAKRQPGVVAIILAKDLPTLPNDPGDEIRFHMQYLGLAVAQTLAAAQHAAYLVDVHYQAGKAVIDPAHPISVPADISGQGAPLTRGNPDSAFSAAQIRIKNTYTTPVEHHNPMELMATVAVWEGDRLTLYDATQGVDQAKSAAARTLDLSAEDVRVLCLYLGGGFGCKGSVWPHTAWAAAAAKQVGRPVKLVVTRRQMFANAGHRPVTLQTLSLGADKKGKLASITHETINATGEKGTWVESSSRVSSYYYDSPSAHVYQKIVRLNTGQPCQLRAPGVGVGMFAMETAMDELAYAANVDPLDLRLLNYAVTDPVKKKPYTSKALNECYRKGAESFGWSKRQMPPRSMRDGRTLIGWGMASANYPAEQRSATALARLSSDSHVLIRTAGHDIGTGMYTIGTQIAADAIGLPPDRVHVELGDTDFPQAPGAGGSTQAVSVGGAILAAGEALVAKLAKIAAGLPNSPLKDLAKEKCIIRGDQLCLIDKPYLAVPLADIFASQKNTAIEATAKTPRQPGGNDYAAYAWGANFVEVRVDENLGDVKVSRIVAAYAAGRILNAKTARSQIMGGLTFGLGWSLMEQTVFDPRGGQIMTADLASYLVPVNAGIPPMDIFFVDEPDPHVNALGAKGIGEIGVTAIAAAIGNAVFHATGKRVRDLPITLDKLFSA